MAIGDVVELASGLVGVIGEQSQNQPVSWRVYFRENHMDVAPGLISQTLTAPSYSVGDTVTVWPDYGDITAISGDTVTVDAVRNAEIYEGGFVTWTATLNVPLWRIIRDNDSRISPTASP